jgi:hypothetical protein
MDMEMDEQLSKMLRTRAQTDQVRASSEEVARMLSIYYGELMQIGFPESLSVALLLQFHDRFWEMSFRTPAQPAQPVQPPSPPEQEQG